MESSPLFWNNMNKPTLVLQFRTDASLKHEQEQIITKGRFTNGELKFVNILDNRYKIPEPKDLDKYSAVITAASGEYNVTDWPREVQKRVEKLLPLYKEIIKRDFPTLSICFGHHMFASLLGGKVERDYSQDETGTFEVSINANGRKSHLFDGIPDNFWVVIGHKDSITKIPKIAKVLARSKRCKFQAYKIKKNIYSVQFHPELDREGLVWRLKQYPEYLRNKTLDDIRNEYDEIPFATKIIDNFRKIVTQNGKLTSI